MTKSADYRTMARAIVVVWVRARLVVDNVLETHLGRALEHAIGAAKRWAELEEELKRRGS